MRNYCVQTSKVPGGALKAGQAGLAPEGDDRGAIIHNQPGFISVSPDTLQRHGFGIRIRQCTGHSSLSYIRRFGLDELKIDRAFVSNLGASQEDTAIVHTIIQLARTLKLSVVAEGVEAAHQLDQLRALGCARAQGFMIGRPEALDKLFPQSVQLGSIERQVSVATHSGAAAPP